MAVTANFLIRDDQSTPAPLDGVLVRIFSDADDYVTEGTTDLLGQLALSLEGSTGGILYKAMLYKSGVSFPPSNLFPITVTDPPPPDNDFEFSGHIGMVGVLVGLISQDDASTPNPVPGTKFRLFDTLGQFLTELLAPAGGEVDLVLTGAVDPGQRYIVRSYPPSGWSLPAGPTQEIHVLDPLLTGATNLFDFTMSRPAVPITSDPLMCRLSGHFINASRQPMRNLELVFRPREGYPNNILSGLPFSGEPTILDGDIITGEVRVKTDQHGYVDFVLPRESVFDLFVPNMNEFFTNQLSSVWVPDLPGIEIHDVLFPYVTKVTYGAVAINLSLSGVNDQTVTVVVETSNKQENVYGNAALMALLVFTTDLSVAMATVTADGGVMLIGIRAGSTNLNVARAIGSAAPRHPTLPDVIVMPSLPTIVVGP
jgi:hypothetical protein